MLHYNIKALVITIDKDFYYKLEEVATKWSFETKGAEYLDWTFNNRKDFKRILIDLLSEYEIEKDYYKNNLKIEWLTEIPVARLPNQYILIKDKTEVKKM